MNETTFKFTSEEKEQTLQILERLRTTVGDTFKPGDERSEERRVGKECRL